MTSQTGVGRVRAHRRAIAWLALGGAGAIAAVLWWHHEPPPSQPATAAVGLADLTQIVRVAGRLRPRVEVAVGARVRRGQLLLRIDPETAENEVSKAAAEVRRQSALNDRARVDLDADRAELGRRDALLRLGAIAQADVDAARARVGRDAADLRAGEATLAQLVAELRIRRAALGFTQVRAPIDGMVASRPAQAGQTVNAVQQTPLLMVLAQLGTMTVRAKVPESDVALVQVGQAASFVAPGPSLRRYTGRIRAIEPQPETVNETRFYNALFEVDNADESLRSDMTVQVEIVTGQARAVPTLPVVALGDRGADGRYAVRVLRGPGQVETRRIGVGLHDDARAQVTSGLRPGERVLLDPAPAPAALR